MHAADDTGEQGCVTSASDSSCSLQECESPYFSSSHQSHIGFSVCFTYICDDPLGDFRQVCKVHLTHISVLIPARASTTQAHHSNRLIHTNFTGGLMLYALLCSWECHSLSYMVPWHCLNQGRHWYVTTATCHNMHCIACC